MKEWARYSKNGYEVSSKGDKRFSAFYAILPNGNSIEHEYQTTVKGYKSIKEGKGKPPINNLIFSRDQLWENYLKLWTIWFLNNRELVIKLIKLSKGKVLTDMFATTEINQARALATIINEYLIEEII